MPELPEVERAARLLRETIAGRRIARVRTHHRSTARKLSPARLRSLRGARIDSVIRKGKHQLIVLDDGRVVHAHFRMTGDWWVGHTTDVRPPTARATIEFDDGTVVALDDPRALATLELHASMPDLGLGPEPGDDAFTPTYLTNALRSKRGAIKPALLDQAVVAGVGNIYAAESLWRARIDPRLAAAALDSRSAAALIRALRFVIKRASGTRYTAGNDRFDVYDREGLPCRRCRTPIERIVQAARSTYFCPRCQAPSPSPRAKRP